MSRVNELECVISDLSAECRELRKQVAAQAAVIESLREALQSISKQSMDEAGCYYSNRACIITAKNALKEIPTDSTQILDDVRRAERERCAKVCEEHPDGLNMLGGAFVTCAKAIRSMKGKS